MAELIAEGGPGTRGRLVGGDNISRVALCAWCGGGGGVANEEGLKCSSLLFPSPGGFVEAIPPAWRGGLGGGGRGKV